MTDADGTVGEPGPRRRRGDDATTQPSPVTEPAPPSPAGTIAGGLVMADPEPKPRRNKGVWVLSALIVVLTLALGSVGFAILTGQKGAGPSAGPTLTSTPTPSQAPFPADTPAAAAGAAPCIPVNVLASLENADMVQQVATGYAASPRSVNGRCVTVTVTKDKSGTAAQRAATGFADLPAGQRPTVWLPDSTSWLSEARASGATIVPATGTGIGASDVVLAMPKPLADAIGWTKTAPTWTDIFTAAGDADVWTRLGHPEWGAFKLGKTSPLVATSGEAAMLASYGVAAGHLGATTTQDMANPQVIAAVKKNELATSHYMATPEHFLWHARQEEEKGSAAEFLSGVIVDEKAVWDYNRGIVSRDGITRSQGTPPKEVMVPIYPKDGFFQADNPAVVLQNDGMDDATKAAAADFIRYAGTVEGQQAVRTAGYRDLHGVLDVAVHDTGNLSAAPQGAIRFPGQDVVAGLAKAFPDVRKRSSTLFLLDVSGSMSTKLPSGQTKLNAAKDALVKALDHFTAGDQVGVAAFSSSGDATITPGIVAPVADIATNRSALISAVSALQPIDYTPLYAAVDTYAKQMAAAYDPNRITTIVLLSDGADETAVPTITKQQLLSDLDSMHHHSPVLVFTLAYGTDADTDTLQSISSASGAHYYDATDPTKIGAVLGDLVTSF